MGSRGKAQPASSYVHSSWSSSPTVVGNKFLSVL
jgi:hypothetical protein